ncbi:sigma 54-interacting transcriptional regulator [Marinobacterium lutimaris]|uniref:Two-component system, NtrC family, response regulator GlrR n=1 Tax=Marinobacterium lutimaris TaxID=568106 RepID=A0A1H5YFW7_9GAMM|nr:sigma 54-interacting transcriptional regulator [Marinobacterium lutimaris]SEG22973.1 two-component system, NtrC family, response regulator GlrR [Marinobacterium lutimaris]
MTPSPHVLLVDQNPDQLRLLDEYLVEAGYRVCKASSGDEAIRQLDAQTPELVICDLRATAKSGLTLSEHIHQDNPEIARILIINQSVLPEALEATAQGAFGIITPPFDKAHLIDTVRAALDTAVQRRDQRWRADIIGRSPVMEQLLDQARRVAVSDVNLIISGQTGSGKELLAQAIHHASGRSEQPLEGLKCDNMPEQMLESELFGIRRGAFDGADKDQPGLLERARGGTLILNEICDLTPRLQVKLLTALENSRVRGNDGSPSLDVRIIATSQRNLEHAMLSGELNDTLYYMLSTVSLEVPALQERAEDIPLLARHFLALEAKRQGRRVRNLSPGAIHLLGLSAWPGNVTQLAKVISQAVSKSTSPVISEALVSEAMDHQERVIPSFNDARAEFERRYLIKLLQITEGNVTHAARIAERNRTDLYKLLGKHDLEPARFKVRRTRKPARARQVARTGTQG